MVRDEAWIDEEETEGEEETTKHLLWRFGVCYRVLMNCEKSHENVDPVRIRTTPGNS